MNTTPAATSAEDQMRARLDALSPAELDNRRREIVNSANGDYESLSVESLQELSFIVSVLRKRSAGPPKAARATASKQKATISDLV